MTYLNVTSFRPKRTYCLLWADLHNTVQNLNSLKCSQWRIPEFFSGGVQHIQKYCLLCVDLHNTDKISTALNAVSGVSRNFVRGGVFNTFRSTAFPGSIYTILCKNSTSLSVVSGVSRNFVGGGGFNKFS